MSETTPEPMSEGVSDCPSCRNSNTVLADSAEVQKSPTVVSPSSEKSTPITNDCEVTEKTDGPKEVIYDDVLYPDDCEDDDEIPYEEDVYSGDGFEDTDSVSTNPGAGIIYDEKPNDENSSLMENGFQTVNLDVELPGTPISSDSTHESSGSYSSTSSMRMLLSTPSHIRLEDGHVSDKTV
uniref:Uncharacterized protein LOC100370193 n=1 Tax=Saccoglossus kowalevskii TaxID=10224 RepID=A0ABM0LWF5_SACKO|nr:PREDICTED: uncharacterized protein LOC100370193 [Saccoglossus kowalevskii]